MAVENDSFHCSAEWHIARLKSSYALAVYGLALKVAGGDGGVWHAAEKNVAEYFGCSRFSIMRAYAEIEKLGFFIKVRGAPETRREDGQFSSGIYRVLSHDTWAKDHPGQCTTKMEMPWSGEPHTTERDRLGQEMFRQSGLKFSVKELNILLARGTAGEIVAALDGVVAGYPAILTGRRARNRILKKLDELLLSEKGVRA